MTVTASLHKGTAVPAQDLQREHVYNVVTTEGLMRAKFVRKDPDNGWLVFVLVAGNERETLVHPNSLFFDPDLVAEEYIDFDPDDPDDEFAEEDGTDA